MRQSVKGFLGHHFNTENYHAAMLLSFKSKLILEEVE